MKKFNDYIERNKSVITGKENLEHLYTIKNLPVFMGCVNSNPDDDVIADMEWFICKDTGMIQLKQLVLLDLVYLEQHNDGTGNTWKEHYLEFAKFIKKHNSGKNILEIGGANDYVAKNYMSLDDNVSWTIVEPNPEYVENKKIKTIKKWFDEKFTLEIHPDIVVHSHVLEHTHNPMLFVEHIGKFLKNGRKHIFSFPNMLPMLEKKFTNCLNFEHTMFITEYFTDYIIKKSGFKILEKQYFGNPHSIFYATEKTDEVIDFELDSKYKEYKEVFMDFVNYHLDIVKELNEKIENSSEPVYLFGAHIFATYLIAFGLNTEKLEKTILDNSEIKNKRRLYGTNFVVDSPKILKDKGKVNVILKAGIYNKETGSILE